MPKGNPTDMDKKIALLRQLARLSELTLIAELHKFHKMAKRITKRWLTTPNPGIGVPYKASFVNYWKSKGIPFEDECFPMSIEEFTEYPPIAARIRALAVTDATPNPARASHGSNAQKSDRLLGTYQIIRPHSSSIKSYILEALEIFIEDGVLKNAMYSHTQRSRKFLYEGDVHIARRYYFSLISRPHEDEHGNSSLKAYRSLAFYVGAGTLKRVLSGILTRGVSGTSDGGTPAVSVPFLAIHSNEQQSLLSPDFVTLREEAIDRLHAQGHIVVGEVTKKTCPILFDYCDSFFEQLRVSNSLLHKDGIVLQTVIPENLKEIDGIDFRSWKRAVEACFPQSQ